MNRTDAWREAKRLLQQFQNEFQAQSFQDRLNAERSRVRALAELLAPSLQNHLLEHVAELIQFQRDETLSNILAVLEYMANKALIIKVTFTTSNNRKINLYVAVMRRATREAAEEMISDVECLCSTYDFFANVLPAEHRDQFRVIKVVYSDFVETQDGRPFAFHCSEPITDAKGVKIECLQSDTPTQSYRVPYFNYIRAKSDPEIATNQARRAEAQARLDWLVARASGTSESSLVGEPNTPLFNQDRNDMIKMLILMHLATEGYLPQEMLLAAGDFMAHLHPDGGLSKLTATTFRGGASQHIPFTRDIYPTIKDHMESRIDGDRDQNFRPFADLSYEQFLALMTEVEAMLGF